MIKKNKKKLWIIVIATLVIALTVIAWKTTHNKNEFVFSTITVEKGNISNTITATGTLEATNTVVVGTQVSGVIEKLYVDFNSPVKEGQLIAELDKSTLLSSLENAEADLERALANYEYQELCLERNKVLFDKGLLAKSEYDLVMFNYKTSKAEMKSARANLSRAKRNLNYASIYSPIDGIVLNRAVEEGQTVAASMNTPELFTITNDLSKMQVEANIDEADIGMLKLDQRVEFTVDAFSDMSFEGKVSEIRLQPNETSNVITYTTIITVSNPDLKLKPGMTASITVYIEEANDVLLVSEKAISFNPDQKLVNEYMKQLSEEHDGLQRNTSNDVNNDNEQKPPHDKNPKIDESHNMVWVKEGDHMHPVIIETGIDDGSNIEVISGLEEGNIVITLFELGNNSNIKEKSQDDEQTNPFVQEGQNKPGGGPPPH